MEQLPKKSTLPRETVSVLKDWILRGVLAGSFPGEIRLKQRLCIGRDTLRIALNQLEEEGWIGPARKGKQRPVLMMPAQVASTPAQVSSTSAQVSSTSAQVSSMPAQVSSMPAQVSSASAQVSSARARPGQLLPVTLLSPFPIAHRQTLMEMEETQTRLAAQGRQLLFASPDIFHLAQPGRQLERLVQSMPSAAWLLFATSQSVQQWFAQSGQPAFLFELPFPGIELPFVGFDWAAAAFHAGVQLLRQGHRSLAILEYAERRPGLVADEEGLERALGTFPGQAQLLVFKDDLTPTGVARSLEKVFDLPNRPTALILTRTAQVLTCYSWLAARGIRIPKDISIISLPNDTWFSDLYPPLCHYAPDPNFVSRKIAERVMELVDNGRIAQESIRAPLNYFPGATIGPAA